MSEIAARLRDVAAASDAYRQTTARLVGLGVPETEILVHLLDAGPRTPTTLARRVGVTPAAATAQLDRLEAAGHVVRTANPQDRRSVLVALTPTGRGLAERLVAVYRRDVAHAVAGLDPALEAAVGRVLHAVVRHLGQQSRNDHGMARDLGLLATD